jgi:PAS domain S-box-containing protein
MSNSAYPPDSRDLPSDKHQGEAAEVDALRDELARTRKRLCQSEERFESLVRCAPDAVTVLDTTLIIQHVSDQTVHIHGYADQRDMIGLHAFELLSPEDHDRARADLQRLFDEGVVREAEYRLLRRDGSPFIGRISGAIIHGPDGRAESIILDTRDITDEKRGQEQLRESEQKFRMLADKSPNMIFINQAGRIVYANEQCERQLGYSRTRLQDETFDFMNLIAPESLDTVRRSYACHMRGEEVEPYEYTIIAENGRRIEAINATRLISFAGRPAILGIVTDITERKRAESALRDSERKFRALSEEMFEGVAVYVRGRLQWCNRAFAELFGYSLEELRNGEPSMLLAPEAGEPARRIVASHAAGDTPLLPCETIGMRKDGSRIDIDIKTKTFTFGDQRSVQMLVRDIGDEKQNRRERELIQANLRQSQKMEAIGRLAGGLAHDFNNLLVAITGYSDLALTRVERDNPVRKDVLEIKKAGMRAAALTRQLLTFGRSQPLAPQIVDLPALMRDMRGLLERLMGENVALEWEMAEDLMRIKADPSQIEQMIVNLAVNARDAMPEGGALRIIGANHTIHRDERAGKGAGAAPFVRLTVADTGAGIDQSILHTIFEPFFTTKGPDRGTGLGLAVVYGVVKQHHGWVDVDSSPGAGASFHIYLPALRQETGATEIETNQCSLDAFRGAGQCVLVIEDEAGVRTFAEKALRSNGYQVLTAATAAEALAQFDKHHDRLELVLSDVVLPDVMGLELAQTLIERKPSLRIILSSGYLDYKSNWETIKARGFPFLKKPYFLADLLKALQAARHAK